MPAPHGQDNPPGPGDPAAGSPGAMRRVEQVFFEVATLAPADRDEAVRRLCTGDAWLEREVRSLMASAAKVGAFLERPALGKGVDQLTRESGAAEGPDDLIGATLGPFRIERRLASGGMGAVYLGERSDGQFELKVAIKVVKRGMDSEEILRRFRAERQTLAALDHPNIARLIDGGITPDGRPFLVMEHVDGVPIDEYCDAKRLKIPERIALFRQVCDAVHHAHQNLVIHRDIKPSNILVTALGIPKLLDFGIAKVLTGSTTDEAVTTDTDRRLTPEYASPEQVEARPVTTSSDVYSLGVVLYELLTGTRPYYFSLRNSEELRRVVCELVPPLPSNAVTVRASRLRTASGLANAATGDPAPPPGSADGAPAPADDAPRTRGLTSTKLRGVLRGDLDTIVMLALRKEPQRRYASAEQFSADLGRYLAGLPVQARRDTLAYRASKFVRRHAVGVALATIAVTLLAGSTLLLYRQGERLAAQRDDLLAANRSLEQTRRYLVAILGGGDTGNLGPDAKLGTLLEEATRALRESPPRDTLTRAAAEQALGRAVMSLGMLGEARTLLESAQQQLESLPEDAEPRLDVQIALAELLYFEGRHPEAEQRLRELLNAERARGAGRHSEREGLLLNNLGASLRVQGKANEAIAIQREALAARTAIFGERSLEVAESRNNLGTALFQRGDPIGAVEQLQAALDTRRALLRPDHPLIVRCLSNLGLAQLRVDKVNEAAANLSESALAWDRAFGPSHAGRVSTITSLSQALRRQNKHDEAIAWLQRSLEWQIANQPKGSPAIAATEANIALALAESGRGSEARPILERVVPVLNGAGPGFSGIARSAAEALESLRATAR